MKDNIKKLTDENFSQLTRTGVTLVDFSAEWCGPCRTLEPILEQLAVDLGNSITIGKLDIDHAQKTTASFQITSVPTLILFKNGIEVERIIGLKDKDSLKEIIQSAF